MESSPLDLSSTVGGCLSRGESEEKTPAPATSSLGKRLREACGGRASVPSLLQGARGAGVPLRSGAPLCFRMEWRMGVLGDLCLMWVVASPPLAEGPGSCSLGRWFLLILLVSGGACLQQTPDGALWLACWGLGAQSGVSTWAPVPCPLLRLVHLPFFALRLCWFIPVPSSVREARMSFCLTSCFCSRCLCHL